MKPRAKKVQTYPFALEPLPFPYDALEPYIDARTMRIHHDKHHGAYITQLNAALKNYPDLHHLGIDQLLLRLSEIPAAIRDAVRNQGGGHANHDLFWSILRPHAASTDKTRPDGALADAIVRSFGSFDAFKDRFVELGTKHFASGWVFLVLNPADGQLEVFSRPNHATVIPEHKHALLINDLWEHAYYLEYQNDRAEYLKAFWNVVDWKHVGRQLESVHSGKQSAKTMA